MNNQTPHITLKDVKKELIDTLTAKYRLSQLSAIEFSARLGGTLVVGIVAMLIALIILQFSSLSLAYFLGEITGSQTIGFVSVSGLYLGLFICFQFVFKQYFLRKTTDIMVGIITHALTDRHE